LFLPTIHYSRIHHSFQLPHLRCSAPYDPFSDFSYLTICLPRVLLTRSLVANLIASVPSSTIFDHFLAAHQRTHPNLLTSAASHSPLTYTDNHHHRYCSPFSFFVLPLITQLARGSIQTSRPMLPLSLQRSRLRSTSKGISKESSDNRNRNSSSNSRNSSIALTSLPLSLQRSRQGPTSKGFQQKSRSYR
jgi:hypothetical protein